MQGIPSYWVDSAARIDVERNTVLHKTAHGELVETAEWLKPGPLRVGITSGASTPDRAVEEVLSKVFKIKVRCRRSFLGWHALARCLWELVSAPISHSTLTTGLLLSCVRRTPHFPASSPVSVPLCRCPLTESAHSLS